jgi:Spy/CpxP family protein refolding chaperone
MVEAVKPSRRIEMNRIMKSLGVGALALGLTAAGSQAFAGMDGSKKFGKDGSRFEQVKERLDLSDAQAADLKDLRKKHREEMKPLRQRVKASLEGLKAKVDAGASDKEIQKALDALKADRRAVEDLRERHKEQAAKILSPTQQAKLALGIAKHAKKRFGKGGQEGPTDEE